MSEPDEMYVFTAGEVAIDIDGRPVSVRNNRPQSGITAIPMNELRRNVCSFIEGARGLMAEVDQRVGAYHLQEVEISAQIGADGKVGFLGSGVGVATTASFKLKLVRSHT